MDHHQVLGHLGLLAEEVICVATQHHCVQQAEDHRRAQMVWDLEVWVVGGAGEVPALEGLGVDDLCQGGHDFWAALCGDSGLRTHPQRCLEPLIRTFNFPFLIFFFLPLFLPSCPLPSLFPFLPSPFLHFSLF